MNPESPAPVTSAVKTCNAKTGGRKALATAHANIAAFDTADLQS